MTDTVWKPHATVAAIIEKDGKYLFVEEHSGGKSVVNQPAGHLEDDESLYDAVIREVREETSFLFAPEAIVGCYRWRDLGKQRTHLRMAFAAASVTNSRTSLSMKESLRLTG